MTIKEIIDGLKFTVDMFLFDDKTGEMYTEPRNDLDKITVDACKGAIELLEQKRWTPVSERLPELDENQNKKLWEQKVLITGYLAFDDKKELFVSEAFIDDVINNSVYDTIVTAWMPKPQPYKTESDEITQGRELLKRSIEEDVEQDIQAHHSNGIIMGVESSYDKEE